MLKANSPYAKIPDDVYDIVFLGEAEDVIRSLAQENNLSKGETDLLVFEVENVFLGETPMEEFPNKIKQKTRLPEEKLQRIITFIKDELFNPFNSSLQEAYRQKVNQKTGEVEVEDRPKSIFMQNSSAPVYRPENFGQVKKNGGNVPAVKTGNVSYQSGVSLKDALLETSSSPSTAADPINSSFAKKLEEMEEKKKSNTQKEADYPENQNF